MTNVHSRHPLRGTVHAPVVTMNHAEAEALRQQQKDAFWNSGAGTVACIAMFLGLWFGIPYVVAAIVFGGTAAAWSPVFMIGLVVVIFLWSLLTSKAD